MPLQQSTLLPFKDFLASLDIDDAESSQKAYRENQHQYDGTAFSRVVHLLDYAKAYCAAHPDSSKHIQAHKFADALLQTIRLHAEKHSPASDTSFLLRRLCEKSLSILLLQYPQAIPNTVQQLRSWFEDAAEYSSPDDALRLIVHLSREDQHAAYAWFFASALARDVRTAWSREEVWQHTDFLHEWLDRAPPGTWEHMACIVRMPFWLRLTGIDHYHIPLAAYSVLQAYPGAFLFLSYHSALPPLKAIAQRDMLDLMPNLSTFVKNNHWISLDEIVQYGPEIMGFYAFHFPTLNDSRLDPIRGMIEITGTTVISAHASFFDGSRLSPTFLAYVKASQEPVSQEALVLDEPVLDATMEKM